ncbi:MULTISPECIES: hypothetical protein [Chroococcidiopsis]|nr:MULTISPECIES: hypothetical protein [Chroococcidiopsis]
MIFAYAIASTGNSVNGDRLAVVCLMAREQFRNTTLVKEFGI